MKETPIHVIFNPPAAHVPYLTMRIERAQVINQLRRPIVVSDIAGLLRIPSTSPLEDVPIQINMPNKLIQPSLGSDVELCIVPDLMLPPSTVQLDLRISYQRLEGKQWSALKGPLELAGIGCIIVIEHPPTGKQVFISYKDPEDEYLARQLQRYLRHVGITGYLAKDDLQYGTPIWKQKLPEAIARSQALAVIWTAHAAAHPHNILREMELAAQASTFTMLAPESRVSLPDGYDCDIEYATLDLAASERSLSLLGQGIYRRISGR